MTKSNRNANREVKFLPVADMHVSKLNMRYAKTAPRISDIYPSILKGGVHQSLLVRKEGKGWGVIAGRRRLFALKRKAKDTGKTVSAPCLIMQSGDVKGAREASLLENIARLPATALERFAAFKSLADAGRTPPEIAESFGVTALSVKQTLALANLDAKILTLFEAEKITHDTLRALTLASPDQQKAWLDIFKGDDYAPEGERLKAWLTGGARIKTDKALFDLETYSGAIITDLFGETGYFQDPDVFWEHQNGAIAAAIATHKSDGWSDVVILERGDRFCAWEFGERSQDQGGKVFVETGHDGAVCLHTGFLANADIKKIDAILNGEQDTKTTSDKPELSGPLADYIALHRHSAIRASLIDHPHIALRLAVAHMLTGAGLWSVEAQKTSTRKQTTNESVAASKGAIRLEKERADMFDLLNVAPVSESYGAKRSLSDGDVIELFARLMSLDDASVMRALTLAMSMSLAAGSRAVEALTYAITVDIGAMWQPDEAFFELLRDKRVINSLVKDIAGKACAASVLTDTGKAQKDIIQNRIAGSGVAKPNTDWRPRWMQIPARSYLDDKTCAPARTDKQVASVMTVEAKAKAA